MPNWCENRIEVSGNVKVLKKFKASVKNEDTQLSLNSLVPLKDSDQDENWDANRCDNWGTKWDVEASLDSSDLSNGDNYDGSLRYGFMSAWSPPCEAFLTGSKKFKGVKFIIHYDEPGMCFKGVFICQDGKVLKDKYIEW